MACPHTERWLEQLAWGGRSPEMAGHLAGCAECRAAVERARRDIESISAALRPEAERARARLAAALEAAGGRPAGGRLSPWTGLNLVAAAALLGVALLYAFGVIGAPRGRLALYNLSTETLRERLADGTRVKLAPGGSIVARGRDRARRVRQVIVLESGAVEVRAPRAAEGETACRVETPEGLWAETAGTAFKVERAWENGRGQRSFSPGRLGGVVTAVLLVTVSEGRVRTGDRAGQAGEVAAGRRGEVRPGGGRPPAPEIAWGRPSGDLSAGLSAPKAGFESGEAVTLNVHLVNTGEKRLALFDAASRRSWRVVFSPTGGGEPLRPLLVRISGQPPKDLALEGGKGATVPLPLGSSFPTPKKPGPRRPAPRPGRRMGARPPGELNDSVKLEDSKPLPPGRYAVTASYRHAARKEGEPDHFWHGEVSTGALEVEIVRSEAQRSAEVRKLRDAMGKAEKAYAPLAFNARAGAAARARAYSAYVLASQRYLRRLVADAEAAGGGRAAQRGREAVKEIQAWLKHQSKKMYEAPPEGVEMWMRLHLGRGHRLAGDIEKAVKEGYEKVLEYDVTRFPRGARPWAWRVHLTAALYRALALLEKAEGSGAGADWKKALGAVAPELSFRPEAAGRPLGIRARLVKGRCLGELGMFEEAAREFDAAFGEIEKLRGSGKPEDVGAADSLRPRAVRGMAEMVVAALEAGVKIRGRR